MLYFLSKKKLEKYKDLKKHNILTRCLLRSALYLSVRIRIMKSQASSGLWWQTELRTCTVCHTHTRQSVCVLCVRMCGRVDGTTRYIEWWKLDISRQTRCVYSRYYLPCFRSDFHANNKTRLTIWWSATPIERCCRTFKCVCAGLCMYKNVFLCEWRRKYKCEIVLKDWTMKRLSNGFVELLSSTHISGSD